MDGTKGKERFLSSFPPGFRVNNREIISQRNSIFSFYASRRNRLFPRRFFLSRLINEAMRVNRSSGEKWERAFYFLVIREFHILEEFN